MSEPKANKSLLQGKKKKAKYLIIGGGAAGFSAIQAIKEADSEAQVKL
jgi:cation diffusion facilitator CzcD-associated flavoprotein CzcO